MMSRGRGSQLPLIPLPASLWLVSLEEALGPREKFAHGQGLQGHQAPVLCQGFRSPACHYTCPSSGRTQHHASVLLEF